MSEEWIVRVQGREYGPVDLETLREWKTEGRVVPANEARKVDVDPAAAAASAAEAFWTSADQIPGLFAEVQSIAGEDPATRERSLRGIFVEAWQIYRTGFWQFVCLSALVVVPSICAQLSSAALGPPTEFGMDIRMLLAATFNLCMLLLSLAAWPLYIAGVQTLTAELSAGRSIAVVDLIQRALKFWPRVAVLCVIVYGSYVFWTLLLFLALAIALAAPSVFSLFFVLLALAGWIWIIGRLWVNFLFWQQFTVLSDLDFMSALRRSKELARGRRHLPWFRRPLWRGVFLASLWFAFVLLFSAAQIWSAFDFYFREAATASDPQTLMRTMSEHAKAVTGFSWVNFAIWLVQKTLQPLLGIAFVLLYFDSKSDSD
jgi:hypothetical protein